MRFSKFTILTFIILLPLFLSAQKDVDETRRVDKNAKIIISNVSGSLEVIGWEKDEVKIEGHLEEDVEELEISGGENRLRIKVHIPRHGRNRHASAYLTIHVPRGGRLDVGAVSADIELEGVATSELEISNVSGRIDASASADELSLETVSGRIRFTGNSRDVECSSVSGSIDLKGDLTSVECGTVSGRIEVEAGKTETGEFGSTSGSIEFDGDVLGSGKFKFKSVSGSIKIAVPENISAEFDLSSFSGSIRNRLSHHDVHKNKYGPGSDLQFVTGSGDVRISASSFSGSVEVRER